MTPEERWAVIEKAAFDEVADLIVRFEKKFGDDLSEFTSYVHALSAQLVGWTLAASQKGAPDADLARWLQEMLKGVVLTAKLHGMAGELDFSVSHSVLKPDGTGSIDYADTHKMPDATECKCERDSDGRCPKCADVLKAIGQAIRGMSTAFESVHTLHTAGEKGCGKCFLDYGDGLIAALVSDGTAFKLIPRETFPIVLPMIAARVGLKNLPLTEKALKDLPPP